MTATEFIATIKPRELVRDLLGVKRARMHQILRGKPLPSWLLARVAARVQQESGRAEAAEMIIATLEADFADVFHGGDSAPSDVHTEVPPGESSEVGH